VTSGGSDGPGSVSTVAQSSTTKERVPRTMRPVGAEGIWSTCRQTDHLQPLASGEQRAVRAQRRRPIAARRSVCLSVARRLAPPGSLIGSACLSACLPGCLPSCSPGTAGPAAAVYLSACLAARLLTWHGRPRSGSVPPWWSR
jgi:hypothetical protein